MFVFMVFSAAPANLHLCSAQGHAEGAPAVLLGGTAVIAEDAEAEDAASTLQDEDMAPALKEQAFVSRLIRQNSMQQHRGHTGGTSVAAADHLQSFAEESEQADEQ
jgi:hypothetical protein